MKWKKWKKWKKLNIIETKKTETKFILVLIFLILISLSIFSTINLVAVIELRRQVSLILSDIPETREKVNAPRTITNFLPSFLTIEKTVTTTTATVETVEDEEKNSVVKTEEAKASYSNVFSEPFFNRYYIDFDNTNLVLDENVTAMTFKPLYELKDEEKCLTDSCGLEKETENISGKIKTPAELRGKEIKNTSYNKLEKNWVVGYVVAEGGQEVAYVYLYSNGNLKPLITDKTENRISTSYGRGGGTISAGGSDKQFIVFYSGYEGLIYLYNNGVWQNLSSYFSLRVTKNIFKAKVIKGGEGNLATWYICADDGENSKLIKLWQNKTDYIQGVIDLSSILENRAAKCFYKNDRELSIVSDNNLQTFTDQGFDNNQNYYYQSKNINNYAGKKVVKVYFFKTTVSALENSYNFLVSTDKENWKKVFDEEVVVDNHNLDSVYLKAEFMSGDKEYSPWFGGLENIFYVAQD